MFTAAGFAKALAYWKLFLQGVVCTVCLSFLTVLFGFLLALLITGMRMSDFRPFRALALTRDGPVLLPDVPDEQGHRAL